jgi:hypothetical protein
MFCGENGKCTIMKEMTYVQTGLAKGISCLLILSFEIDWIEVVFLHKIVEI